MTTLVAVAEPRGTNPTSVRWYEVAVIYELHVRAFYDSDGNGAGDFAGLMEKLDYLQELGVTALWLLPFCPSPWRDDGYDVSDHVGIHPAYGCLDDFQRFLAECKRRNLRVITELVLNHTSIDHPWFERARRAPSGSRWRDFYVWSQSPDKFSGVRIIFKDFERSNWTWDPVAGAYYWHRFYSHQPDLNFASADVRQAAFETVDFWLGMGVDGLRLDAVPYLYEREGTLCENLPETHAFLRDLRSYIDKRYDDRMLLAEANQWPEDAVAYFGNGDECHMAFNFPLMPRLFMATRLEDSFPIINIVGRTPSPPAGCQWATFLRNHDELTLEMVCEEERDYMYRMYAEDPEMRINLGIRRRLAPLLGNDRRRIKLMNALLFSLPGTPVIYYGDEIGMGEDLLLGDRNSVRTPMQWSAGPNAGFSPAKPDQLYLPVVSSGEYAHGFVNVESQTRNPNSLLWWMRHALAVRRNTDALTSGAIEFVTHNNRHVLAFLRQHPAGDLLVIANLSRYAQPVQLALASYSGRTPVEAFGCVEFPAIRADPYQLSVAPYGFYWFFLPNSQNLLPGRSADGELPRLKRLDWENREVLARFLKPYLKSEDVSRPRKTTNVEVIDLVSFSESAAVVIVRVSFTAGDPEVRLLPLTIERTRNVAALQQRVIAQLESDATEPLVLCTGTIDGAMSNALLNLISGNHEHPAQTGRLRGVALSPVTLSNACNVCLLPNPPTDGQRNASSLLGSVFVLKLYRKLEIESNPDIATVRYLFEQAGFSHVAPVFGWIEYVSEDGHTMDAAVLHAFVENRTDLWQLTLDELSLYLERAATEEMAASKETSSGLFRTYIRLIRLLGTRTAEMHVGLVGPTASDFAPEPFTPFAVRGTRHSMASMAAAVRQALSSGCSEPLTEVIEDAAEVLDRLDRVDTIFSRLLQLEDHGLRIRVHGDLHLGQVLHTGDDLVFIDFEGDSSRPMFERLIKTSPLVDVAGMLFSLRYAATSAQLGNTAGSLRWHGRSTGLKSLTDCWYRTAANAFATEYLRALDGSPIVPRNRPEFDSLLGVHTVAKSIYQLGYELSHRPEWLPVALTSFIAVTEELS